MSTSLCLTVLLQLLAPAAAAAADDYDDDDDDEQLLEQFKAAVRNRGELGGWNRGDGLCRFPGAVCVQGGRMLASLSLAGVQLDIDFRAVAGTLLRLGGVQAVSLRGANVSGSLADGAAGGAGGWRCGQRLAELDLSRNGALRGSVLDAGALAGACGGLRELNLSGDALVGGGKGDGGADFSCLDVLDLSYNMIGDLSWMARAGTGGVRRLDLSSNALTGAIPASLCPSTGSKLEVLYLQNNYLTGGIPQANSNCRNLESLDLSLNYINGSIPTSVGSLRRLRDIILWENQLEDEIPASLAGATGLENLILDYNGLTGSIPSELVNCKDLNWISLASNRLSGPVPAWIGQLHKLAILKLSNNSLSGPIPAELGDCKRLLWLYLFGETLILISVAITC